MVAWFDLKSAYDYLVPAKVKATFSTSLRKELPKECYWQIAPWSGHVIKHFVDVGGELFWMKILFLW